MKRVTLFDGASIKSKDLSGWTADEYFSVFGSYFGSDETTPRSLYAAVGWLYACVNLRADRIASLPWAIFQGQTKVLGNDEDLAAYPYLDNFGDLLELTEMALCLCGYAYWFKQRNARNAPLGDTLVCARHDDTALRPYRRHCRLPPYDQGGAIGGPMRRLCRLAGPRAPTRLTILFTSAYPTPSASWSPAHRRRKPPWPTPRCSPHERVYLGLFWPRRDQGDGAGD
jgi:hypothetical protein